MSHGAGELAVRAAGVSKTFGAVHALRDVSLGIPAGKVSGLIGANGAGKTTLFDVLCGITRPDTGRVTLLAGGLELDSTRLAPYKVARLGVQRTFQQLRLAMELTVEQNLLLGRDAASLRRQLRHSIGAGRQDRRSAMERVDQVAATLRIDPIRRSVVKDLSYGERKLVSLGRALTAEPRVLLLDEPTSGLDEASREEMITHIRRVVTGSNVTVCVIEHSLIVVESLAEHLIFMEHGAVVAAGQTQEVLADERLATSYFGARREAGQ
jgi:ABC-type branched-subunit amino acid transport system ATPase component